MEEEKEEPVEEPTLRRIDYGIDAKDLGIDAENTPLKEVKISEDYKSIIENPIYQVLGSFNKMYLRNEQHAHELFLQLKSLLGDFETSVKENFYYQDMGIVNQMEMIIWKYREWVIALRQNSFLAKEKMNDVARVNRDEYVTKNTLKVKEEESSLILREMEKGFRSGIKDGIVGARGNGTLFINIPFKSRKEFPIGSAVEYKHIGGIPIGHPGETQGTN